MKTINYNKLRNVKYVTFGSYSNIYECEYDEKKYILKEYKDGYLDKISKKLNKLNRKINQENLILPSYFVSKSKGCNMVLINYSPLIPIYSFYDLDLNTKINILKKTKEIIKIMHDEKIIHGDLHEGNILTDDKSCDVNIIDFDNSSYKGSKIVLKDTNDYSKEFIKNYGLLEELDTFIFNLVTFDLLNNCGFYLVRDRINKGSYGVFENNNDAKIICNSFFLDDQIANGDYLIDTVDELILKK